MRIFELNRQEYEYFELHYTYTSFQHFVPEYEEGTNHFSIRFLRKPLSTPYRHDSYDAMYSDWQNSMAFGLSEDDGKTFLGYLEVEKEEWNSRLRICNLLIREGCRGRGLGTELMEHAKQLAEQEDCRVIVLETQSCNVPAIDFYQKCGFHFGGTNLFFYSNRDMEEDEVMLEMVYFL